MFKERHSREVCWTHSLELISSEMLVGCLHFTSQNAFSHLPRNTFGKLSYWLREIKVNMKLLTVVCNSAGTLTLASFLMSFLERVAFYLLHFCFPINNWAYGTADGLCPIPGTVTSNCDHGFLHFCLNLVTYLQKTKYLSIFWSGKHGRDFQGEHSYKHVLQEIGSHLHPHLISDSSLTEMLLFWHTVHHFRYSTFFFILRPFTKLPAFLCDLVSLSQPGLSLCLIMYSNLTTPMSE